MLIYSMSVSVDGFVADREGAFGWTAPSEELFRFHLSRRYASSAAICAAAGLRDDAAVGDGSVVARQRAGGRLRRRLVRDPKVVFSRTLDSVEGNARLAEASVAEEAAAALDATDKDVSIGGA